MPGSSAVIAIISSIAGGGGLAGGGYKKRKELQKYGNCLIRYFQKEFGCIDHNGIIIMQLEEAVEIAQENLDKAQEKVEQLRSHKEEIETQLEKNEQGAKISLCASFFTKQIEATQEALTSIGTLLLQAEGEETLAMAKLTQAQQQLRDKKAGREITLTETINLQPPTTQEIEDRDNNGINSLRRTSNVAQGSSKDLDEHHDLKQQLLDAQVTLVEIEHWKAQANKRIELANKKLKYFQQLLSTADEEKIVKIQAIIRSETKKAEAKQSLAIQLKSVAEEAEQKYKLLIAKIQQLQAQIGTMLDEEVRNQYANDKEEALSIKKNGENLSKQLKMITIREAFDKLVHMSYIKNFLLELKVIPELMKEFRNINDPEINVKIESLLKIVNLRQELKEAKIQMQLLRKKYGKILDELEGKESEIKELENNFNNQDITEEQIEKSRQALGELKTKYATPLKEIEEKSSIIKGFIEQLDSLGSVKEIISGLLKIRYLKVIDGLLNKYEDITEYSEKIDQLQDLKFKMSSNSANKQKSSKISDLIKVLSKIKKEIAQAEIIKDEIKAKLKKEETNRQKILEKIIDLLTKLNEDEEFHRKELLSLEQIANSAQAITDSHFFTLDLIDRQVNARIERESKKQVEKRKSIVASDEAIIPNDHYSNNKEEEKEDFEQHKTVPTAVPVVANHHSINNDNHRHHSSDSNASDEVVGFGVLRTAYNLVSEGINNLFFRQDTDTYFITSITYDNPELINELLCGKVKTQECLETKEKIESILGKDFLVKLTNFYQKPSLILSYELISSSVMQAINSVSVIEAVLGKGVITNLSGYYQYIMSGLSNQPLAGLTVNVIKAIGNLVNNLTEYMDIQASSEIDQHIESVLNQLQYLFALAANSGANFAVLPPRHPDLNPDDYDFGGGSGGGSNDGNNDSSDKADYSEVFLGDVLTNSTLLQ